MKTTATARKTTTPRVRTVPAASSKGGTARRKTTTGTAKKKPIVIKKPRWQPAPRPTMFMICQDFTIKLCRGLVVGIGLGLVVSLAVPWMMDTGEWLMDKYYEADLAIDWTAIQDSLQNKTSEQVKAWKRPPSVSSARPPLREVDPRIAELKNLRASFPQYPRTITLVHVGHTGLGRSVIEMSPTLTCKERFPREPNKVPSCIQSTISKSNNNAALAQQLQNYFHLGSVNVQELQASTSLLYTLRNPVDRILAIFKDAHPLSCAGSQAQQQPNQQRPWGCETAHYWNMPGTPQYAFYNHCFPDMSSELFAQAVGSPWPPELNINSTSNHKNAIVGTFKERQANDCRWMARSVVMGSNSDAHPNENVISIAPHMYYNYEYYVKESLWKYSGKEVLVIRGEQEQRDLALLNSLVAGANSSNVDTKFLKPAEASPPATITAEAYQKLCCILEREIDIYESILLHAANLPQYAKEDSLNDLRRKCGLSANRDWQEWRVECKNKLEMDLALLSP